MILFFVPLIGRPFLPNFRAVSKKSMDGEDPSIHVMTYQLWCSSNLLNDDSMHLWIFHETVNGTIAKWYVELP